MSSHETMRRMTGRILLSLGTLTFSASAGRADAIKGKPAVVTIDASPEKQMPSRSRFYLVSEPGANLLVFVGPDFSMLSGIHRPSLVAEALALLKRLRATKVKWALLMEDDEAATYLDGGLSRRGAVTVAHEMFQLRMNRLLKKTTQTGDATAKSAFVKNGALPDFSFSHVVQVYPTGEETHFIHDYNGYTDADVIVHFEESGLLYLGNSFTMDGYPAIDVSRGGDIAGLIKMADWFVRTFERNPGKLEPIVPGRGRIAAFSDLREYRDVLVAVRDRVEALITQGLSKEEAEQQQPTRDFDARWGQGPVSASAFVGMVYESVTKSRAKKK